MTQTSGERGPQPAPSSDSPSAERTSEIRTSLPRGKLRILTVDDEVLIGMLIKEFFCDDCVEAFVQPDEAVARARNARFDLIFCDQSMPIMTGIQVFAALRPSDEQLASHFVLMTGFAESPEVREFLRATGVPLLRKPFHMDDLERYAAAAQAR